MMYFGKEIQDNQQVRIYYRNHRGDFGWRNIYPVRVYFGVSDYHRGEQWLLEAIDADKRLNRTFAMKDILSWTLPHYIPSPKELVQSG